MEPRRAERLTRRVAAALTDESNQLWLSPIAVWEFLLLAGRGRVRIHDGQTAAERVEAALSRAPMHKAPINREVAVRSRSIRVEHVDPADRLLAATADVYELTLVTADERLLRGKGFRTLTNCIRGEWRPEFRHGREGAWPGSPRCFDPESDGPRLWR